MDGDTESIILEIITSPRHVAVANKVKKTGPDREPIKATGWKKRRIVTINRTEKTGQIRSTQGWTGVFSIHKPFYCLLFTIFICANLDTFWVIGCCFHVLILLRTRAN